MGYTRTRFRGSIIHYWHYSITEGVICQWMHCKQERAPYLISVGANRVDGGPR